ncbi:MAG TPA: NnrS family protein [Patescibacteria group bacterium]|nr:NnrS family protein [Patescibacteria group bacterium]
MLIQIDTPASAGHGPAVFSAGFRPFFLLAGLQAALMVPVWLVQYLAGATLNLTYAPFLWHGHEMVFGFATAAIGGFLLTAVPNWTGAAPVKGRPLMGLAGLWLAARVAFALGSVVPPVVAGALDLAFLPMLGFLLAKPLIGAGKLRNIAFLPILGLLTLADGLVVAEMTGLAGSGRVGLYMGLFIVLLMISIIGGRIIPGFTSGGLRPRGIVIQVKSRPWLDKAAIGALVATAAAVLAMPGSLIAGALAILAAVLHAVRLSGWYGWKTGGVPLLWVLHLGYAWLPLGLLLLGLSSFVPAITPQVALHGLTVGCAGMMVLGVMTRAALGHSGRRLEPARLTVAAYALVAASAFVRVFGVMIDPTIGLWLSGLLWSTGFTFYLIVYAPVCLTPRQGG